jgi:type VII secretion-associated protein (TIGR03931 family)
VTEVVLEVGPTTVAGHSQVSPELVAAAFEFIDDELGILDDQVVAAQDLWNALMSAHLGSGVDTAVLICPTWWAQSRIDRVRTAACTAAATAVVLQRTAMLRAGMTQRRSAIIEIAPEFVVVTPPAGGNSVLSRRDRPAVLAGEVLALVGASAMLVDVPAGVLDAEPLAQAIADRAHSVGVAVVFADEYSVRRAVCALRAEPGDIATRDTSARAKKDHRRAVAALASVASTVAFGLLVRPDGGGPAGDTMRLLVEGRVGVMVPAAWTVQRVTSGPGSARVEIVSPSNADVALLVTQSSPTDGEGLAATADVLLAALALEPEGVFIDFNASGHRAGKDAVTYREVRVSRHVTWAVFTDGAVRIAIGCQSAPGGEDLIRTACDQAIGSAHAVF